jgi:hexosaminidase
MDTMEQAAGRIVMVSATLLVGLLNQSARSAERAHPASVALPQADQDAPPRSARAPAAADGRKSGEPPHPGGHDLSVRWTLLANAPDGRSHRARWSITNHGSVPLPARDWTIYFNMLHLASRDPVLDLPPSIQITHFNGDLFKLQPADPFTPLPPGETFAFEYQGVEAINKPSWGPQGLYIVFENEQGEEEQPSVIEEVVIDPFIRPEQIDRGRADRTPIPTPDYLFGQNEKLKLLPPQQVGKVTPTPVVYKECEASLKLTADWTIRHEEGLGAEARHLAGMLQTIFERPPIVEAGSKGGPGVVLLRVGSIQVAGTAKNAGSEAYLLRADPSQGIVIEGADDDGVFYGVQTLLQLLPPLAFAGGRTAVEIPAVHIEDAPRFSYRGQHIDVSHNFHGKQSILRLLDRMAFYKLNTFHFQVSDDEGWRIEIPQLPELTSISSTRAHTRDHDGVLHPSYGTGPFREFSSYGSGYYTRDDFIEILRHARSRHIDVIPEINMPAHARAAIIAMKAREKRLTAEGRSDEAVEFRLHDPDDTSRYISAQGFLDNAVCVAQEQVYHFAETIIESFEAMYREAGVPLRVWHFGADEVPQGVWSESPVCRTFLQQHSEIRGAADLKNLFVRRLLEILRRRNLQAACWQEAALDHERVDGEIRDVPIDEFAGGAMIPYVWNNLRGNEDLASRFANSGYPVVLCCVTNLYFDLAYNKDPLETGLSWGGFIDARSPFEFVPEDVFKSTRVDSLGRPYDRQALYRQRQSLTAEGLQNILGIQGQIWCETIKGPRMLDYYVYPKQIALAERAWAARPAWARLDDLDAHDRGLEQAWNEFANRLGQRELPRLDHVCGGTAYRLPPPGAVIVDGQLHANSEYPGLPIRFTIDGSHPSSDSAPYAGPVPVSGTVHVATFDSRGRASRPTRLGAGRR